MKKISYMLFICAALLITSCASTSRTGVISPFAYTEVHPNEIRVTLTSARTTKSRENPNNGMYLAYVSLAVTNILRTSQKRGLCSGKEQTKHNHVQCTTHWKKVNMT